MWVFLSNQACPLFWVGVSYSLRHSRAYLPLLVMPRWHCSTVTNSSEARPVAACSRVPSRVRCKQARLVPTVQAVPDRGGAVTRRQAVLGGSSLVLSAWSLARPQVI